MMLRSIISGIWQGRCLRRAVDQATAALNIGDIRKALDLLAPAHREAPTDACVMTLLGQALISADCLDQGFALLERAIALAPELVDARIAMARQLQYSGRIDKALEHLRAASEFAPDAPQVQRALLRPLMDTCDWAEVGRKRDALLSRINAGKTWTSYAAPIDVLLLGLSSDERRASAKARTREILQCERPSVVGEKFEKPNPDRLRVGYLSGDFRDHAVTHLAGKLFSRHDRTRFEIHAFSYGRDDGSPYRQQVMAQADHFVDVRGKANVDIARAVRLAGIDILVDLAGHTDGSRLGVLAHRPSPVQVHYLGYPGTSGAEFVDYFIADRIVAPVCLDTEFTERFVRLADCFMISDDTLGQNRPQCRADHGLPEDGFVFVNFNQNSRIDASIWRAWMEILRLVPDSVLWLKHSNDLACERLRSAAADDAVNPARIVFAPDLNDKSAHIARLQLANLGLDTVGRYNGHTSTADALWAGIPVVTTASDCFPGRVAASLLTAAGMAECITDGIAAYKTSAIRFATEPMLRRHIQTVLRCARGRAPFFQPDGVVRGLEQAYEAMWERFRTAQAPAAMDL